MKKLFILAAIIFIITSCTREAQKSATVKIKLPEKLLSTKTINLQTTLKQNSTSLWGLEAPIAVSAADCFAAYATIPESSNSTCVNSGGTNVISVHKFSGMNSAGANLEIELPSGKAREIGLLAFKSSDGTCKDLMDPALNTTNFSAPLVVGKTTTDLAAGVVEINLPLSMTNAQSLEKCAGEPLNQWPLENSCAPTIAKMISIGSGQLTFEGTCLTSANSLEILNSSTNEKTALNILSKSTTNMTAKLSSSLTMNAGVLYKLIVTTASAQVTTPISLQVGSTLTVNSNGTKVGSFLTSTYSPGLGNGLLMASSSDQLAVYFNKNYTDPSGTNIINNKFYLYKSIFLFNPIFQNLSPNDLLNANVLTPSSSTAYGFYYTGADCTGDLIIQAIATEAIKGNIFIQPTGCTYSTYYTCTGFVPKKITTTGTYQTGVTANSQIFYDSYSYSGSPNLYCQSYNYPIDGYVIPSANIVNTDANDPPAIIEGVTISH